MFFFASTIIGLVHNWGSEGNFSSKKILSWPRADFAQRDRGGGQGTENPIPSKHSLSFSFL